MGNSINNRGAYIRSVEADIAELASKANGKERELTIAVLSNNRASMAELLREISCINYKIEVRKRRLKAKETTHNYGYSFMTNQTLGIQ